LPKTLNPDNYVITPTSGGDSLIYSEKLYTDPTTSKRSTYDDREKLGNVFPNDLFWRK